VSRAYDTAADARNAARENAFTQVVQYYGQYIRAAGIERSSLSAGSGDVLSPYIEREEEITRFAQSAVSQVGAGGAGHRGFCPEHFGTVWESHQDPDHADRRA
jgi:hypothetical protein